MPRKTANHFSKGADVKKWHRLQVDLRSGRFSEAIEVARKFHADRPSDETLDAMKRAIGGYASQLLQSNRTNDVKPLLEEAERLNCQKPDWVEQLGLLWAQCGNWQRSRALLDRLPGTNAHAKALGWLADSAMRNPNNGRNLLPPEMHAGLDSILAAFASYQHGDDEAARTSLQSIGLQSPFSDWKLLLRGLIAYSANDDARANDNWQRLDAPRLPAQLAEPFRYQIDKSFRASVAPNQLKRIAQRSDRLSVPLLTSLRDLQRLLSTPDNLPDAFRRVRPLIGMIKLSAPDTLQKLANCFYWLIVMGGHPDDLDQFASVFGAPADDPQFSRLTAMVMESTGQLDGAHKHWQEYSSWIAAQPDRFPGEFGHRARAMIAVRMGDNALAHEEQGDEFSPESFFDFLEFGMKNPPKRKPLKPSAESCYQTALNLSPEWKDPHKRLLQVYLDQKNWEKAEPVGRNLVERFPDDAEALTDFSEVLHQLGKDAEAVETLRTALKHNPLDGNLRSMVAHLTLQRGRAQSRAGEYEAARESFRESLKLDPKVFAISTRAAQIACEFKAGCEAEARRLMAEFDLQGDGRHASVFVLLAEATAAKCPKNVTAEFKAQFEESLKEESSINGMIHLLMVLNLFRGEADRYHGFGTHEKKILARMQTMVERGLPEGSLVKLGIVLVEMRMHKPLKMVVDQGLARFSDSPAFQVLKAQQTMLQRPRSFNVFEVGMQLAEVLEQVETKSDPLSTTMRLLIDRSCEEHPRLREVVERQREFIQDARGF